MVLQQDTNFESARISITEDSEDPSKSRNTPTTSIQFLCPGRIDDSTVYWDININTTAMLAIIVTVLPWTVEDPYITSGWMVAYVTLRMVNMEISNQLLGNTGVSIMNIRIKEAVVPAVQPQNKVSNGCSLMYGREYRATMAEENLIGC